MSQKEAAVCDPQQRVALEVAYMAVRDAYLTPHILSPQGTPNHRTGVFVGAGSMEHMAMQIEHIQDVTQHTMSGNTLGNIANRISYCFNWTGPSFAVDTACSSSLTALHLAIRSLQCGDCDTALVIGINLLVGPGPFVGFSQAKMLSPTGTSRPFDQRANGFVRGEGCAAFLLQRTDFAPSPARGIRCRALVRGVGINEDGKTSSLTFPSAMAQAELIRQVLDRNDLNPKDVVFLEAHGTGTQVGDKEECTSISTAFKGVFDSSNPLRVGSVKGNLGHLETGAAVASMAKVVLMLQRRQYFPTAGYEIPNPAFDMAGMGLRVEQTTEFFPNNVEDPLIGINSYGFGGANGHVVLSLPSANDREPRIPILPDALADRDAWMEPEVWKMLSTVDPRRFMILPFSTHFPEGVDATIANWQKHMVGREGALPDLIALQGLAGDHTQRFRCALIGNTAGTPEAFFKTPAKLIVDGQGREGKPRLGFIFGGQGSHHARMGLSLFRRFKVFRDTIIQFNQLYKKFSGISIMDDYGFCGGAPMKEETLNIVEIQMPCIIAVQVGLVALLKSFGVEPSAVLGHSSGEMVAAWSIGVADLEALCKVTYARASGQQNAMPEGAMASVGVGEETALQMMKALGISDVDVAAVNSIDNVTLAGPRKSIEALGVAAKAKNVLFMPLPIPRAYHSRYTEGLKEGFFRDLKGFEPNAPKDTQKFYSTVTGEVESTLDANYWWSNVRSPVQFHRGILRMKSDVDVMVEIGPHSVLRPFVLSSCQETTYISTLVRSRNPTVDDVEIFLQALGQLYVNGVDVDWKNVQAIPAARINDLTLPPIVWKHGTPLRHGKFKEGPEKYLGSAGGPVAPAKKTKSKVVETVIVKGAITAAEYGYMKDHVVNGQVTVPGAAFVSLALEMSGLPANTNAVHSVSFERFCEWTDMSAPLDLNKLFDRRSWVMERNGVVFCRGQVGIKQMPQSLSGPEDNSSKWDAANERCKVKLDMPAVYRALARFSGIAFGPEFRRLESVSKGDGEVVAVVAPAPDALRIVHPTILDACFQLLGIAMGLHAEACVPTSLGALVLKDGKKGIPANERVKLHLVPELVSTEVWTGHIDVYAAEGRVAAIRGITLTAVKVSAPSDLSLLMMDMVPFTPVAIDLKEVVVAPPPDVPAQPAPVQPVAADQAQPVAADQAQPVAADAAPADAPAEPAPAAINVSDVLRKLLSLLGTAKRPLQLLVSDDLAFERPAGSLLVITSVKVSSSYDVVPAGAFDVVCCTNMSSWQVHESLVPGGYGVLTDGTVVQNDDQEGDVAFPRTVVIGKEAESPLRASGRIRHVASLEEAENAFAAWGARVVVDTRGSLLHASALVARLVQLAQKGKGNTPALVFSIPASNPEIWGFSRTARNEFPQLSIYSCDTSVTRQLISDLARARFALAEYELREGGLVPRLFSQSVSSVLAAAPAATSAAKAPEGGHFRLCIDRPGQLQSLSFRYIDTQKDGLASNEIRVNTVGIALHFKDVMLAMNMLAGFRPVLGLECSGVVSELGEEAAKKSGLKKGDPVLCVSMSAAPNRSERKGMMASSVVCEAHEVVRAPENVPLDVAAGYLGVMATAYYCLVTQARVARGQWVLIHSAMGGVGQSAMQIALGLGCRVIGTAGSAGKRAKLLEMGVTAVFDSHDPSIFYDEVMKATGGRGVDVVLNSLSGDGLMESVRCLAPLGKFCEIGKSDILSNTGLGLALLKQNVTFYSCHLDLLADTHPEVLHSLLVECTSKLRSGELRPIETQVVPFAQAPEVFRKMSQGQHEGKLVLKVDPAQPPAVVAPSKAVFVRNGTYVLTGATRGIGLAIASWIVLQGARHLVLLGSSSEIKMETKLALEHLRSEAPDLEVKVESVDLTNKTAVEGLLKGLQPPVRGIFHLATSYVAGMSDRLTEQGIADGFNVKAKGALVLDKVSRSLPLDIFFVASSLAGLYGNHYQAVYAAANSLLHRLAHDRRAAGLPAVTMDFPMVLGAGRLSDFAYVMELELNAGKGFAPVSVRHLCDVLGAVLSDPARFPPHVALDRSKWQSVLGITRYTRLVEHNVPQVKKLKAPRVASASKKSKKTKKVAKKVKSVAASGGEGSGSGKNADELVLEKLAFLLGCPAGDIDRSAPMSSLGIDSLAAMELSNWCTSEFGASIGQTAIVNGLTAEQLIKDLSKYQRVAPSGGEGAKEAAEEEEEEEEEQEEEEEEEEVEEEQDEDDSDDDDVQEAQGGGSGHSKEQVEEAVLAKLGFLLGCDGSGIDKATPLSDLGIDSLAAVELTNWSSSEFNVNISQTEVLNGMTVTGLISKMGSSAGSSTSAPKVKKVKKEKAPKKEKPAVVKVEKKPVQAVKEDMVPKSSVETKPVVKKHVEEPVAPSKAVAVSGAEISVQKVSGAVVVDIKRETFTAALLDAIIAAVVGAEKEECLVISSACSGMDLSTLSFGTPAMDDALRKFSDLHAALEACPVPIIHIATGAVRGGGMIFPAMADFSLAVESATFGFPEIRRGALPGIVSVAASRRLSKSESRRLMLTGDAFDAQQALRNGYVDFVGSSLEEVERESQRLRGRFHSIVASDAALLRVAKKECPANSIARAIVTMGELKKDARDGKQKQLVKILYPQAGVAVIELDDPDRANAMDEEIAVQFGAAVEAVQKREDVRCLVVQGNGAHFCTGIHPFSFVKALQSTTVLDAAARVFRLYSAFCSISKLNIPVLCVVHGKVVGGGFALSLNADWRIATSDAVFNYGNLPRGVCPGLHLSRNLPSSVGSAKAMSLYLDDPTLTAQQLHAEGIVNVVASSIEDARAQALAKAVQLAAAPRQGVSETLGTMRRSVFDADLLAQESLGMAKCLVEGGAFGTRSWVNSESASSSSKAVVVAAPSAVQEAPAAVGGARNLRCGVHAIEVYIPNLSVKQSDLEAHDNVPGKYTKGLLQERIAFCGDNEDATSMALTAVTRLLERTGVSYKDIGRLEVGTESMNDRSKSIKTSLMKLFVEAGNTNIEGVDTYNACYGGTAALFNTVSWMESSAYPTGKLGIVVAVDIADWDAEHRWMNGASAVAMLVGPNAPLELLPERFSHFEDEADFYKPIGVHEGHPVMPKGGQHSVACYERALTACYNGLRQRLGDVDLVASSDYMAFHSTSVYLINRGFRTIVSAQYGTTLPLNVRNEIYERSVEPSTRVCAVAGSMYTAAVYTNLASLLDETISKRKDIVGKTVLMYSYGSGLAASLYRLRINSVPTVSPVIASLAQERVALKTPKEFVEICELFSSTLGKTDYVPKYNKDFQKNVFYLEKIDAQGLRHYKRN